MDVRSVVLVLPSRTIWHSSYWHKPQVPSNTALPSTSTFVHIINQKRPHVTVNSSHQSHLSVCEHSIRINKSKEKKRTMSNAKTGSPAALSRQAIFFMALLTIQFGAQPMLITKFTPKTVCRSTVIVVQESVKFCLAFFMLVSSGGFRWTAYRTLENGRKGTNIPWTRWSSIISVDQYICGRSSGIESIGRTQWYKFHSCCSPWDGRFEKEGSYGVSRHAKWSLLLKRVESKRR